MWWSMGTIFFASLSLYLAADREVIKDKLFNTLLDSEKEFVEIFECDGLENYYRRKWLKFKEKYYTQNKELEYWKEQNWKQLYTCPDCGWSMQKIEDRVDSHIYCLNEDCGNVVEAER